ncbi:putative bzip transcription factor [Rosellinia necatrix]|uniref:Putative bzip transcription factor n=1 Tax=Rosellinia necatrix TaxID=77044 RepID=A0A1S7UMK7_ROSNE|nr:putative bzip transcription factor [Rosellinia necatrix]
MAPAEPKPSENASSLDTNGDRKIPEVKNENNTNNEPGRPLAPPPKPGEGGDYFSSQLSLEPNPFEQSFGTGGGTVETPGGTKLPSLAALTSPSSLLPGNGTTPFNWGGGSLRTGPLSPAMLSGPTDYFGDTSHTLRSGFTPNESSLRTGLTPGGSGSMFPAPSPNTQAIYAQINNGGATPSTIDFHRTALSAAAAKAGREKPPNPPAVTSQPQEVNGTPAKSETKPPSGAFDPHDNDAANGLFMLAQGAQGRNGAPQTQYPVGGSQPVHAHPAPAPTTQANTSPQMNGKGAHQQPSGRGVSEAISNVSEESEPAKPNTRAKGKRGTATTNGRRKADDTPAKPPANKKAKTAPSMHSQDEATSDEEDDDSKLGHDGQGKTKMTDEEKRKNFLERNRVAALKCRQRKKQWLANLQSKVEMFSQENDSLTTQILQLREEVVNLKTLLLAHKDCPVTQQQGLHGAYMQQTMESYDPQANPYGMGAGMPNQPVMAGQGVQRRFS